MVEKTPSSRARAPGAKPKRKKAPAKMGRPAAQITDDQRTQTETMAAFGVPASDIAAVLKVSETTLKKYCSEELRLGAIKAKVQVVGFLFQQCKAGNPRMIEFFLANRDRENWGAMKMTKVEHSGAIGSYDLTKLNDQEFDDFERLARKAAKVTAGRP